LANILRMEGCIKTHNFWHCDPPFKAFTDDWVKDLQRLTQMLDEDAEKCSDWQLLAKCAAREVNHMFWAKDNDTFDIKISSWHSAVLIQVLTDLSTGTEYKVGN